VFSILQCFSKTFSKTDLDNLRFTPLPTEGGIRLLNLDNCTEQFLLSHMVTKHIPIISYRTIPIKFG